MRVSRIFLSALLSCASFTSGQVAPATPALMTLTGDGLTLVIFEQTPDNVVTGELRFGAAAYPFTGTIKDVNGVEMGQGKFVADGQSFAFTTREAGDDGIVEFITDGKTYRLAYVPMEEPTDAPNAPEPAPAPQPRPAPAPRVDQDPGLKPVAAGGVNVPQKLVLRRIEFPDVSMGGRTAYTMLLPEGWQAQGQIEWHRGLGVTPHPQKRLDVNDGHGGSFRIIPAIDNTYTEKTQAALQQDQQFGKRFPDIQGTPPPNDLGAYIVQLITQSNNKVSNVRLISQKHDEAAEQSIAEMVRQNPNPNGQGPPMTCHIIDIAYDEAGVAYHEQINVSMGSTGWMRTQWMNTTSWTLYTSSIIRAPEKTFDQQRPMLASVGMTFAATDKWFTNSQLVLMQMVANQHEKNMAEILRRGQEFDRVSDQQMQSFRARMASGDRAQDQRLNTINEASNFNTPEGGQVKLPIHYKNYYGDGKGNFVMTNSTMDAPGGEFKELTPAE